MSVEEAFAKGAYDPKGKTKRSWKSRPLTAWGETKTIEEWAADPRARVKMAVIVSRIKAGRHTPEQAISLGFNQSRPWRTLAEVHPRTATS
ncbi:MAG: hypothetical protein HC869_27585 [Rhodospirillales bacterium]|nr:hypothetical protein [Rhodospirillales bacterium]